MSCKSANSENFSTSYLEGDIFCLLTRHIDAEILYFQNIVVLELAVHIDHAVRFQFSSNHHLRDLIFVCVLCLFLKYQLTISQNDHIVRELHNLVQTVADEDNGNPAVGYRPDTFEEFFGLTLRQNRRRLVKYQKL